MYTNDDSLPLLCTRFQPLLRRWARSWLARAGAGVHDADDLVQTTLLRALHRLDTFEMRGEAGLLAWLRQILLNEVRGELRRRRYRGEAVELNEMPAAEGDATLEATLAHERECAYAGALRALNARQRRHIALRIEHGMSFSEIAAAVGGNADSARMIVVRAMRTLTQQLAAA